MKRIDLYFGDNRIILPKLAENSVDSIVTDPPYEINMMGKSWDRSGIAYDVYMWQCAYRVLKPGGYLLAFGATRTYHRMACAVEDAGFRVIDQMIWLYSEGFPKSHNLKGEHEGKGSALKPAHEPIVIAQKPFRGTILDNVQKWGVGVFNIDQSRIPFSTEQDLKSATWGRGTDITGGQFVGSTQPSGKTNVEANPKGRWPANVLHDGSEPIMDAFAQYGERTSGKPSGIKKAANNIFGQFGEQPLTGYGDTGSLARFFYCPKATKADREEGLRRFSLQQGGIKNASGRGFSASDPNRPILRRNTCPTVKPVELMRYLCKLVTPTDGTVLDPFMGSGSTGKAAAIESFGFVGIDKDPEHFPIAKARIHHAAGKYKPQSTIFNHGSIHERSEI
ncbi:DNA-methyltransferase [Spirosoma sordidisoli]|uniref:Methyltransferase n=1 Tax=Spirosoma sordidisoli TaxID=2502893 RepID=A0A4Q2USL2_9BACT|nr:site-specific DNA-methyltransferase [Spirosoma sordidisoli]RYC70755.1 site-specific DNA-methyltransferase [Spirosoma sordidisoli]